MNKESTYWDKAQQDDLSQREQVGRAIPPAPTSPKADQLIMQRLEELSCRVENLRGIAVQRLSAISMSTPERAGNVAVSPKHQVAWPPLFGTYNDQIARINGAISDLEATIEAVQVTP